MTAAPDAAVFWRLHRHPDTGVVAVVELQWFDEYDYDPDSFINSRRYPSEAAARVALNNWLATNRAWFTPDGHPRHYTR